MFRQVTEAHLAIYHDIHIYKNGKDIRRDSIFRSEIPCTKAAKELIERQGHMAGCQLDHVNEIQDVVATILEWSEEKAIAYAWESLGYMFMTRQEHNEKTRMSKAKRKKSSA